MLSSVQKNRRHKQPKKPKRKQQQLKVVYISNPVRVNTSAAKFRALVQELTGQDADDMPAQPMFPVAHDTAAGGGIGTACEAMEDHVLQVPSIHHPGTGTSSENSNLVFEDAYVPQLQENFPAGIPPSNMWYESI